MRCLSLILLVLMATTSYAEWDEVDLCLASTFFAMKVVDIGQTNYALQNGGRELNPVFGQDPSPWKLYGYHIVGMSIIYYAADQLDSKERKYFLIGCNMVALATVLWNNGQVGISIKF